MGSQVRITLKMKGNRQSQEINQAAVSSDLIGLRVIFD